jgi:hypothetical protein
MELRRATIEACSPQRGISPLHPTFSRELCPSGLWRFDGTGLAPDPVWFAGSLVGFRPLHLLVNRAILETQLPELATPQFVIELSTPEMTALASPVLLDVSEASGCLSFLGRCWREDTVVCLFSRLGTAALLAQLREALRPLRSDDQREDEAGDATREDESVEGETGLLGLYVPSVAEAILTHQPSEVVERWLSGIDAVLLESPTGWSVFSSDDFGLVLEALGFVETIR